MFRILGLDGIRLVVGGLRLLIEVDGMVATMPILELAVVDVEDEMALQLLNAVIQRKSKRQPNTAQLA